MMKPYSYFRVSALVRVVYPDCELEHGRWVGPEWQAADALCERLDRALDGIRVITPWGSEYPAAEGKLMLGAIVAAERKLREEMTIGDLPNV